LIALGIMSFWRGAWGLQDVYLFPGNLPLSYAISTVLGLVVIVVSHHTLD
jgi:Fuseless